MNRLLLIALFIIISLTACDGEHPNSIHNIIAAPVVPEKIDSSEKPLTFTAFRTHSNMEQDLIDKGLIDIKTLDSSIVVDLKYSTTDNFLGLDVYGAFNKCYLQPDVAKKLATAQHLLRSEFPYYNIVVYDAVRPRSIQYKMWDTINIPFPDRSKYLSNPKNGSLHNYGAAVDVSIIDENGYSLDMGTRYDYFGELAYPREEDRMIKEGKLTRTQLLNREVLRRAMIQAGFSGITTEWWHFNSCSRQQAFEKYGIIE